MELEGNNSRSIIIEAIKKATGIVYEKSDNDNLLRYFGPLPMVYIIHFVEEISGKNISASIKGDPDILTVSNLTSLL